MTNGEQINEARRLVEIGGWKVKDAAAFLGVRTATIYSWRSNGWEIPVRHGTCRACGTRFENPKYGRRVWCSDKCRKTKYSTPCVDCGAATSGLASGRAKAPKRCASCSARFKGEMAREYVIDAIKEWHELFGEPPSAADWNIHQVRARFSARRVRELEEAHKLRAWPSCAGVQRAFGSWNAAIAAAGFEPVSPGQRRNLERWRKNLVAA